MSEKLMIIDGNSIVNRAFYGVPLLTDPEGRYTNGVYGFLNIFFKLFIICVNLLCFKAPFHVGNKELLLLADHVQAQDVFGVQGDKEGDAG